MTGLTQNSLPGNKALLLKSRGTPLDIGIFLELPVYCCGSRVKNDEYGGI